MYARRRFLAANKSPEQIAKDQAYQKARYQEKLKTTTAEDRAVVAKRQRDKRLLMTPHDRARFEMWRNAKDRSGKRGLPFDIALEDIVVADCCPVLGVPFVFGVQRRGPFSPTLDRLRPALGYVKGNIAVVSFRANMIMHDASFEEILAAGNWLKAQC